MMGQPWGTQHGEEGVFAPAQGKGLVLQKHLASLLIPAAPWPHGPLPEQGKPLCPTDQRARHRHRSGAAQGPVPCSHCSESSGLCQPFSCGAVRCQGSPFLGELVAQQLWGTPATAPRSPPSPQTGTCARMRVGAFLTRGMCLVLVVTEMYFLKNVLCELSHATRGFICLFLVKSGAAHP